MKTRTVLNIFLFIVLTLLSFTAVQMILSVFGGASLVYTPVSKEYYKSMEGHTTTKKRELLAFATGKSTIARYNVFNSEERQIPFDGVQIGTAGDAEKMQTHPEDVAFFLDNPSACAELSNAKLLGTVAAIPDDQSTVQVQIGRGKEAESRILRVGEEVTPGTVVAAIRWNVVAFKTSSGIRCLGEDVGKKDKNQNNHISPRLSMGRPPKDSGGELAVRQIGDNQYVVKREDLQKMTANLNALARQARIVPARGGGFKIYAIKRHSIYRSLGIKNGDVIKSINGMELSSPDKALEAYSRLQTATKLSLDIKRRGQAMTLDYMVE